ncbi:MAG TPA: DUF4178 domain-containing protein [Rhodocyclaceae bacterium]|nr:DUF4178 domain-containing protein [Rhodocyclaceae bacterium]
MAALVEDRSPLQLGTEGRWQGLHFALIGRIQLRYSQGLWNEWHLMFDDMNTGWLSEASGEYALTFQKFPREPIPAFTELQPESRVTLFSRSWVVTNIEDAECIAGQGELPFKVGAGYKAPVVDLRDGDNFATIDYSETPPLLFIGSPVKFEDLALNNLRSGMPLPDGSVQAQVFRCPSCGSPLSARSAEIKAVGCGSCGAVVDTADQNYKLLSKAMSSQEEHYSPRIAIGTQGVLEGKPVEVIGFLAKRTMSEGLAYDWREYLLAGENGTYRWLVEYNGHWNIVDVLSNQPRIAGAPALMTYEGLQYKHFSNYEATVLQVAGEFTWRVTRGEKSHQTDYVAPPLMASRERTAKEISWSMCRYAEADEIQEAFKLKSGVLPKAVGVYANQPNPWQEAHRRICGLFWKFALVATVVQLLLAFVFGGKTLLQENVEFTHQNADETFVSRTFELSSKARKITVENETDLNNNWFDMQLVLVNKETGANWPTERGLSYYHGVDGGESWSEGSRSDDVSFVDIPAGTYYLAIDPELAPENRAPVRSVLKVSKGGVPWSNYVLIMIFLVVFPLFSRMRYAAFETSRWAESDHAPVSDDDDDE